jgi:hypothetical protein
MSYDALYQMDCCLSCGGPLQPSREALRRDKVGSRALNFIEGDAIAHKELWNLQANSDPTLISVKEDLHLFHTTNVQSAMSALVEGPLKDVWLDSHTPQFASNLFDGNRRSNRQRVTAWINGNRSNIPEDMYVIGIRRKKSRQKDEDGESKSVMKAVMWEHPPALRQFDGIRLLIMECLTNVEKDIIQEPNLDDVAAGCKMCNNIMTVLATSSHFLVRTPNPLVGDKVILAIDAVSERRSKQKSSFQPNRNTKDGDAHNFAYEACVAYYLHRCLPPRWTRLPEQKFMEDVRKLCVFFAWIVLQVLCLEFEKAKGLQGGRVKRVKPAYRYRGCTEMYLAYFYWILLQNDNPEGEAVGAHIRRTRMPFCQFHRYFFTEVVDTLILAVPDASYACEVMDLVCEDALDFEKDPHQLIGQLCDGMVNFYRVYIKPYFSRHLASLEPNPGLLITDPLFVAQCVVRDRIISDPDMRLMTHVLQGGTEGDVDTFIDSVGVTSVMKCWQRLLSLGEYKRTVQLLEDFTDAVVLTEYQNISQSMSSNPEAPSVSLRTAETVYLLCSVLQLMSEPDTEEELQLLRVAPKRSPYCAVVSLQQVGAFKGGA